MGLISNQWLLDPDKCQRDRSYSPISVSIRIRKSIPHDTWAKRHGIVVCLILQRQNKDVQELQLTIDEAIQLISAITLPDTKQERIKCATAMLTDLTDSEILEFISKLLPNRQTSSSTSRSASSTTELSEVSMDHS